MGGLLIRKINNQHSGFNKEYQLFSQKIAEAIKSVVGIDVTIMDSNRKRVAGTGRYLKMVNKYIQKRTAFDICLQTGLPQEILNAGENNCICFGCPVLKECTEKAEICVPILLNKNVIGVIGVIAFDEMQNCKIIEHRIVYLDFLQKMASLLEAKYARYLIEDENQQLLNKLANMLNVMSEGIIVYDNKGSVVFSNKAIKKLYKEMGIEDSSAMMNNIWHYLVHHDLINNKGNNPVEIVVNHNKDKYHFLSYVTIMSHLGQLTEVIVSLHNQRKITKKIIQSAEINHPKIEFNDILGTSKEFLEIKTFARKAALTDSNILIYGESGTGKELFARAMHDFSPRKDYPFVPINCGAIPENLLESELFGYVKGAFTGAADTKIGKLEVAENGTVFLDEISEMPLRLQVKLLRTVQEKEVCRVGCNKIRKLNIRIISATNAELLERIQNGSFREDLYYRLNIIPLDLPPLRERVDEIIGIAYKFVKMHAMRCSKDITGIALGAQELLLNYNWPGNIRELQNVIEYAVTFETGKQISETTIAKRLGRDNKKHRDYLRYKDGSTLVETLQLCERNVIIEKVNYCKLLKINNKSATTLICKELGISRATLYRKLKEYGIYLSHDDHRNSITGN